MTVACSRVSSMSVRAVITSYAWTTGSDPKLGVGRSPEMFTGTGTGTGTVQKHRDMRGAGTHTVPNCSYRGERYTPLTRARARIARAAADVRCMRLIYDYQVDSARESAGHTVLATGRGTERKD